MCSAVQITIPMRRKAKRGDFPFLDPDLYSTPSSTLRTKGVEAGHVFTTHYCNTVCMVKVRLLLTGHNNVNVATKLPDWFDWHENRRKIFNQVRASVSCCRATYIGGPGIPPTPPGTGDSDTVIQRRKDFNQVRTSVRCCKATYINSGGAFTSFPGTQ